MKKVIILLFMMFLVLSVFVQAEKVAVIEEVLKPVSIAVDDTQLYITEGATIFIYSLKDYKFIKKFGREGQGPKEFARLPGIEISVNVATEDIIVNSFGKVSFFSKDGSFKREIKSKGLGFLFTPIKENYVGLGRIVEDRDAYNTINFYDAELNRGQEIARMKIGNPEKKLELLKKTMSFVVYENKVYLAGEEGFVIKVLDHTGQELYSITREYKRIKFDSRFEKEIREGMKKLAPGQYEFLKNRLEFPDYFPAISFLFIDNNKIHTGTWNLQQDKLEFYIFDLKGKLLKTQFVTFAFQEGSLTPYPLNFKNGKLYQLIENEEEEWELHISMFD